MKTVRTVAELRAALSGARRAGRSIGLVPTMGALHAGHLSLVRRAREQCDVVVVSLFVNPAQFEDRSDLAAYPRDEERDRALAAAAGADLLFSPDANEVYPAGFSTRVEVSGVTETLEGEQRGPAHFRGVAAVVLKLLNMVGPDVAYFGQKDAQQLVVVRRLVRDLDVPVRIEACPTVREPDGVAMSSRNALLSGGDRDRARALSRALAAAGAAAQGGERRGAALLEAARDAMSRYGVAPEYVALVHPETFAPLERLDEPALLAVAARVGRVRLIDNALLQPAAAPGGPADRARPDRVQPIFEASEPACSA